MSPKKLVPLFVRVNRFVTYYDREDERVAELERKIKETVLKK